MRLPELEAPLLKVNKDFFLSRKSNFAVKTLIASRHSRDVRVTHDVVCPDTGS